MKIFISSTGYRLYKEAVAAQNFLGYYQNTPELTFLDVKLVSTPGMPANNIFAGCKSNLFFGTDLISDMNEIKVLDQSDVIGSNLLNYLARFSASCNFGFAKEIVVYGTAY